MEKQDAAMDSRLPAFICATMSSRNVLLMLLISSIGFGIQDLPFTRSSARKDTKNILNNNIFCLEINKNKDNYRFLTIKKRKQHREITTN